MRKQFVQALYTLFKEHSNHLLMTGDLGYMALEPIRDGFPRQFINAGVAEQNMVSAAAGLAYAGIRPWLYSIAPFITLKTYEQLRNDVSHTNLPVTIVGNGGGYGYGRHGSTHHILEDIALFSSLPSFVSYIPAFNNDIEPIVNKISKLQKPSYLRLGLSKSEQLCRPYTPLRKITQGRDTVIIALGPLVHNAIEAKRLFEEKYTDTVSVWVVTEIPFNINVQLMKEVAHAKRVIILEESVEAGGLGQYIFSHREVRNTFAQFIHLYAKGYVSKLYGSQDYHRAESDLHPEGILKHLEILKKAT